MEITTPNDFASKMKELAEKAEDDEEEAHVKMDDLMCDMLHQLGYSEGVKVFKATKKYYS